MAGFDWDKESAPAGAASGFDWESESHPHPDEDGGPSPVESGVRGLLHGATKSFAPAIAGAGSALLDEINGDPRTFADAYRAERDDSQRKFDAAKEANPTAYDVGEFAGNLGTDVGLTALTGGASIPAMMGAGALGGALSGVGEGVSHGSSVGDTVEAGAKDAALQGAVGGLGALGGKVAGAAFKKVAPGLSEALDRLSIAQGRRAMMGGTNTLAQDKALPDAVVRFARDNGGMKAFDTVGNIAERTGALRKASGKLQGDTAKALSEQGLTVPTAKVGEQLLQKGQAVNAEQLVSDAPRVYQRVAKDLVKKSGPEGEVPYDLAERFRQSLQKKARNEYKRLGGSTERGGALMDTAGQLASGNANALADATAQAGPGAFADLAAQHTAAKEATSNWIAANDVAKKAANQAAKRSALGLTDNIAAIGGAMGAMTGHPGMAVVPIAKYLARTRGASTASVAAGGLAKGVNKVAALAASNPAALGKYGGVLSRAVAQGPEKFATVNFLLSKDPGFQAHVQSIPDQE